MLPDGMLDRTGLRRWFRDRFSYQPGWRTLEAAISQGMPCEPHPLTGKPIFDPLAVEAWLEERRRKAPVRFVSRSPLLS
jgi:hypothetical protein